LQLSAIHQVVIGGAAVGATLVALYALLAAPKGAGATWDLLAGAAACCAVALAAYLRRFRRTHGADPV
jgi:hypothetical protein